MSNRLEKNVKAFRQDLNLINPPQANHDVAQNSKPLWNHTKDYKSDSHQHKTVLPASYQSVDSMQKSDKLKEAFYNVSSQIVAPPSLQDSQHIKLGSKFSSSKRKQENKKDFPFLVKKSFLDKDQ